MVSVLAVFVAVANSSILHLLASEVQHPSETEPCQVAFHAGYSLVLVEERVHAVILEETDDGHAVADFAAVFFLPLVGHVRWPFWK